MKMLPNVATNKAVYDRYMGLPLDPNISQCTYVWIDGTDEFLRSKTRTMDFTPKNPEGVIFLILVNMQNFEGQF